jgi:hypothetical protein
LEATGGRKARPFGSAIGIQNMGGASPPLRQGTVRVQHDRNLRVLC